MPRAFTPKQSGQALVALNHQGLRGLTWDEAENLVRRVERRVREGETIEVAAATVAADWKERTMITKPATTPTNGLDRCDCGCKYWVLDRKPGHYGLFGFCFDCGAEFDPKEDHE